MTAPPVRVELRHPYARPEQTVVHALPGFRARWIFRIDGGVQEALARGDNIAVNGLMVHAAALRRLGPALLADRARS